MKTNLKIKIPACDRGRQYPSKLPNIALAFVSWVLLAMMVVSPAVAEDVGGDVTDIKQAVPPAPRTPEQQSVQKDVEKQAKDYTNQKCKGLVSEAVSAMVSTKKALALLSEQEPKTDEALAELEKAIGKLELTIARNPGLATIPVAVEIREIDIFALPETVDQIIRQAKKAMADGKLQMARRLLNAAREELKFGQKLGYYNEENIKPLYEQITRIEEKTKGGKSGTGWFDKIKEMVNDLF